MPVTQKASEPVSRVLSFKTVICLGTRLPVCSRRISKYRPSKPLHSALLRIGFTGHRRLRCAGELLPRLSTLTRKNSGGISLLHFPLRSPSAAVSRYPALRSPDFPHQAFASGATVRPTRKGKYTTHRKKSQISPIKFCGLINFFQFILNLVCNNCKKQQYMLTYWYIYYRRILHGQIF